MAQTENERQAALLVEQALHKIDQIIEARPQQYADVDTNYRRTSVDKRKFTLADAKPRARHAARLLREAWELLDPSNSATCPQSAPA